MNSTPFLSNKIEKRPSRSGRYGEHRQRMAARQCGYAVLPILRELACFGYALGVLAAKQRTSPEPRGAQHLGVRGVLGHRSTPAQVLLAGGLERFTLASKVLRTGAPILPSAHWSTGSGV
jgi:hypothetical protein